MSSRGPEQRAWWLAGLAAAVLLGVLAMTWFAPQRAAHAEGAGAAPHSATDVHQTVHQAHGGEVHAAHLDEHSEKDHSHALDVLLGFFLGLLSVVLLSLWARVPRRPIVILRRVRERLLLTGRPPDPPSLTRLSIQRC